MSETTCSDKSDKPRSDVRMFFSVFSFHCIVLDIFFFAGNSYITLLLSGPMAHRVLEFTSSERHVIGKHND